MEEEILQQKKRRPIRTKIQRVVLIITLVSLIATSSVGLMSMLRIRSQSEQAFTDQAQNSLREFADSRTKLADASFAEYAGYVEFMAGYITSLYRNEEVLIAMGYEVPPPLPSTPEGAFAFQRSLLSPEIKLEDVHDQMLLLSNMEHIFQPMIQKNAGVISVLYIATQDGLMLGYDADSSKVISELQDGELYYDYRDREWFSRGRTEKGAYYTGVYADVYGRGLTITCAAPFFDAEGDFVGVIAADIQITDLYNAVINIDLGRESSVFLVDHTGHVISPNGRDSTLEDHRDIDEMTARQIMTGKSGIRMNDDGIYHAFSPISSVGWELVIHVPQSQVLATVRRTDQNIRVFIAVFGLIVLAAVVIVLLAVNRFSRVITIPLLSLGEDVEKISGGDLDHRAKVLDNDELGDLAGKFNEMADSLKKYIKDVTVMASEKEHLDAELGVATKIQADMLPTAFPAFPGNWEFDVFASMTPAREVGGDFYDYFLIDADHLCVVMADVSGKGIPAALFMVVAKTMLKNQALLGDFSPSEVFIRVNDQLCENNREQLFVTAWMGILTLSTGELVYANAGHEYPICGRKGEMCELITGDNDPPLAVVPGLIYQESRMTLNRGDLIFVYTDGVTEAKAMDGTRFGNARLIEALGHSERFSSNETVQIVRRALRDFVENAEPFDDVTMLALIYRGG